ncbi:MAG: hypothetical protein J3T61_12910, partial [Candidatus Brocadiales bacterium]|nr:hypothetical protein [Candidatus Bathyanammoxibius sp.]
TKLLSLTAAVVAVGAVFVGCESLWNDKDGTLSVLLTDAPFPADLVDKAIITIDSLRYPGKKGTVEGAGAGVSPLHVSCGM